MTRQIQKIITGGQTGVDRAALDFALEYGIPCGGWCPKGRRAEDGRISDKYPLQETPSEEFSERTEWNVRDSDGTLILLRGAAAGGTLLTIECARKYGKPYFELTLGSSESVDGFAQWAKLHKVRVLNIAGPRESEHESSIYQDAILILPQLFSLPITS